MKKVLASVGIGNASVDTIVPDGTVRPGDTIDATVHVTGGAVEQEVGRIRFELETRYLTEDGYEDVDIARYSIDGLTIEPETETTHPVEIDLPYETPVTVGGVDVWVETELDIDFAVDPDDTDALTVAPTPRLQTAFDAMEELGFALQTAECEADPYDRYGTGQRFVQEFEFRPTGGPFASDVDEVELIARPGPDECGLSVEVDRNAGLLSEMADTDERTTQTAIRSTDVAAVADDLESLLRRHV
jgi:sporulation-control protein